MAPSQFATWAASSGLSLLHSSSRKNVSASCSRGSASSSLHSSTSTRPRYSSVRAVPWAFLVGLGAAQRVECFLAQRLRLIQPSIVGERTDETPLNVQGHVVVRAESLH